MSALVSDLQAMPRAVERLRQPLSVIAGYTQMLRVRPNLPAETWKNPERRVLVDLGDWPGVWLSVTNKNSCPDNRVSLGRNGVGGNDWQLHGYSLRRDVYGRFSASHSDVPF
ncbi:MAG TPA: hypothetical protein VMW65_02900 [Chloroflexota bacterium]|nr:hypothetical protein [Chloroflexota bacterium]